ncbi:MAG: hypothetical protein MK209_10125 [Planctomycetes bacterium]|nr:hypothetical protein [Planctomycetota bacterium]
MFASFLIALLPQFADASIQSLEARLLDRNSSSEARVLVLEELAMRTGAVSWEACEAARAVARGPWTIDYVRVLGRAGEEALPELRKYARSKTASVRAEAVYSLVKADQAGGERFGRQKIHLRSEPVEARIAALRGLADRGSIMFRVEALRALSKETPAPLKLEALEILARNPGEGDVRYLIDVVDHAAGRVQGEAVRLLQEITGYRIDADARSWRYFMLKHDAEGTDFKRDSGPSEASHQTLSYMGIPIQGERIVFVLDASGSMNSPLAERTRESRGHRAVSELAELLPRLPDKAAFDIVFFESTIDGFGGGRLVNRRPARLDEAAEWLARRDFDGGTNLYGGLEEAFSRKGVEEIILLTDGMPSAGEVQSTHRILAWVQRWNRWRKVRVSTIGLSAPRKADSFLSKLAEQNGGVYRAIR